MRCFVLAFSVLAFPVLAFSAPPFYIVIHEIITVNVYVWLPNGFKVFGLAHHTVCLCLFFERHGQLITWMVNAAAPIRDDREEIFTFPFPPIPMQSIPIPSISHSQD